MEFKMGFIEKMGNVISEKGKEAADKTRTLAEIMNRKSQISTCEEVIRKNYLEIGRLYYEEHCKEEDAAYKKQLDAIRNARKGVEELQAEMELLKNGGHSAG